MKRLISVVFGVVALACTALATRADSSGSGASLYTLRKDSHMECGCFAPCECPVLLQGPVAGRFRLRFEGFDGLFENYTVDHLRWVVHQPSGDVVVTGAGTYRIGGEAARQHQLSLDLQVGSDLVQHFDSGLMVPTSNFPNIDARISIHGEWCHDTVFDLRARRVRPLTVGRSTLSWDAAPAVSGHDVVHGSLSTLRSFGGDFSVAVHACDAENASANSIPCAAEPSPGEGYWFLLRDVEAGIAGSYDSGSESQVAPEDASIAGSPSACP